jgi:hypothetical protein
MQSVCLMECEANASDSLKEQTNLVGLTFGGYLRSKVIFFSYLKKQYASTCHGFATYVLACFRNR